mgnify:CR=1 FL=1
MPENSLLYDIALSLIPGIGSITARQLTAFAGSSEAVLTMRQRDLIQIPGIGEILAERILHSGTLRRAEEELRFLERYKIKALTFRDSAYPERLRQCPDAPLVLYVKGEADLNAEHMIAMVGTRSATNYGKKMCYELIDSLTAKGYHFTVVSGLAYGIDVTAHRASLKAKQPTIAVLGHGLSSIYPPIHAQVAREICREGALVTDFVRDVKAERKNFLRRNRIIAGLSEATIVVESAKKGGALVTADIAVSYNRDVLAFPGKATDPYSAGCNHLIRMNKAALIASASDLEYALGWTPEKKDNVHQQVLFTELQGVEKEILDMLRTRGPMMVDELALAADIQVNKLAAILLNLELLGRVECLPGKVYQLC